MASRDFRDFDWSTVDQLARRSWGRMQRAAGVDFGEWGGKARVGKMLASGDLRLVALFFIEQQPRHGYDLIKAVEEASNGVYSPSPGIVYPALTYLEEAGFATSSVDGNKKLYAITDEGRAHLEDNREAVAATLEFLARTGEQVNKFRDFVAADWPFGGKGEPEATPSHPAWAPDDRPMHDVVPELDAARKAVKQAIKKARTGSDDVQLRAAEILRRAAADIEALGQDDDVDL
ncbi:PadR family transcriptional regulator [Devosia sp. WQ 349K1]|uniref:PadR family transcriptional regulator n=1 Tax=Devosia sp. WQ 349K1 TaxID=2800329 RepID=UPI0020B301AA|nr:PadR family transcriptional regulator [Devosia sp. WQ 349K1]